MNEWQEWKKRAEEKQRSLQPPPVEKSPAREKPITRRKITAEELKRLRVLEKCSIRLGHDRWFLRSMEDANEETEITDRQGWYIHLLYYRYRRQTGYAGPKPEGMV